MSNSAKGCVRLRVRYFKALIKTINVVVYTKFPEILTIDQARNVNVSFFIMNPIQISNLMNQDEFNRKLFKLVCPIDLIQKKN